MRQPRKPSLDSIRAKDFTKELSGLKHLPDRGIIHRVDSKLYSLNGNLLYNYKPHKLAAEEYKRCLELFEIRLPYESDLSTAEAIAALGNRMENTISLHIETQELIHKDELEQLAVDTVRDMYDIPEHIKLLPNLDVSLDVESELQDDSPDAFLSLSDEEKKSMRSEIQKRVILNGLVHGSAMHIWKSAHYIIKDKIDEMDPLLMTMYNEYTAGISWLLWQISPDDFQSAIDKGEAMTQGFNQLEFEESECNVHCHAVNFPVLLHEVAKGAMDYLICHGIPQEYSEEQLEYYYAEADSYENEVWHYLMSPTLWTSFISAAGLMTQELPAAIMKMARLNYSQLIEVLRACVDDKEMGNMKLKQFKIV